MKAKKWLLAGLLFLITFLGGGIYGIYIYKEWNSFLTLIGVAAVGFAVIFFFFIYYFLAPRNMWFTFIKEGTAKTVVKGDAVEKFLIQWSDYTFNYKEERTEEKWQIIEGEEKHLFGGLRLYSIFFPLYDIFVYRHKWTHLHENGEVVSHDEWLDFVFLKEDMYVIEIPLVEEEDKLEGAEDINGLPLGIQIVVPMRIVNPYVAVFRVRRWLPMISGIVESRLRRFVANFRYKEDLLNMSAGSDIEELHKSTGVAAEFRAEAGEDLWKKFWQLLEEDLKEEGGETGSKDTIRLYGVEINKPKSRILKINPPASYRKLTTLQYEAERQKERIEIEAEAEKERIRRVYQTIEKYGEVGKLVRALEAIEKGPGEGGKWVIPLPGIAGIFKNVFGKEEITAEEAQQLKKLLAEAEKD